MFLGIMVPHVPATSSGGMPPTILMSVLQLMQPPKLLQDLYVLLAVEKIKHKMVLEGIFEKANKLYTEQERFENIPKECADTVQTVEK
jgi:hypothetical protein